MGTTKKGPAVAPDPANPGFFVVDGVVGYFRQEDAERIARQLTPKEEAQPAASAGEAKRGSNGDKGETKQDAIKKY